MDIRPAIEYLESQGLVLPHGIMPGSYDGGEDTNFDEAEWEDYKWNPPEISEDQSVDSEASAKPTWQELENAREPQIERELRDKILLQLETMVTDKIIRAYGADDWQDEIQKRLGGRTTAEQDEERDRLIDEHKKEVRRIKAMNLDELEKAIGR